MIHGRTARFSGLFASWAIISPQNTNNSYHRTLTQNGPSAKTNSGNQVSKRHPLINQCTDKPICQDHFSSATTDSLFAGIKQAKHKSESSMGIMYWHITEHHKHIRSTDISGSVALRPRVLEFNSTKKRHNSTEMQGRYYHHISPLSSNPFIESVFCKRQATHCVLI